MTMGHCVPRSQPRAAAITRRRPTDRSAQTVDDRVLWLSEPRKNASMVFGVVSASVRIDQNSPFSKLLSHTVRLRRQGVLWTTV